jgi:hypothetical protein
MTLELTKTETTILLEAAARADASIVIPERLKPVTQQRLLGKLLAQKLIRDGQGEEAGYVITRAGYRAVGLRPPRQAGAPRLTGQGTKQSVILGLMQREEGASLTELATATGWLPHTTRAALSRLRADGVALVRMPRAEGGSSYRIMPVEQAA